MKKTLLSIGIGAGIMYLLDPELGEVRRSILRDRLRGIAPKTSAAVHDKAETLSASAHGFAAKADERAAEAIEAIPVDAIAGNSDDGHSGNGGGSNGSGNGVG